MIDRGFIDHELLRALNEKGIACIIPAKKNMEIYQNAVEIAQMENKWLVHPNKNRKNQKIQLVEHLEKNWQGDEKKKKNTKKR